MCEFYIISYWRGFGGLFLVCWTDYEYAEMPENYRLLMDYKYIKKKEGNLLAEIHMNLKIIYKISQHIFFCL
jgi:hypothetical protein